MTRRSSLVEKNFVRRLAFLPALMLLAAAAPEYTAAPVPHDQLLAVNATDTQDDTTSQPRLRPHFFHTLDTGGFRGDGFTPGSTVTAEQERSVPPEVGFNLIVPLQ